MAMLSGFTAAADRATVGHAPGPLVDDGAPCFAIGILDLRAIADDLGVNPDRLMPIPDRLSGCTHW